MSIRKTCALLLASLLPASASFAQTAKLSVTSLKFAAQMIGSSSVAQSFTLTNTDAATPLAINSILDSSDYSETDTCGTSLAPLASCTIFVTFAPTVRGTVSGAITIDDDASDSPQLVSLSGNGVTAVTFSPANFSFGTVPVGTKSAPKTLMITNNQNASVTLQLATSGDYSAIGNGTAPCGANLAARSRCTVAVTFQPTVAGAINGALSIAYSAPFSPLDVPLSGTGSGGSPAPLAFTPSSLSFGNVVVNATSAGKIVTVKNVSTSAVTINTLLPSGNYSAAGSGATPCGGILNAGSSCTFTVTFTPTIAGTAAGAVTVNDNASDTPQVLSVTGNGIQLVTLTPATLTFAAQRLGTTSPVQTVTLTNHQPADTLAIDDVSITGDFNIVATGKQPCGSRLAALASCTIGVVFAPPAGGGSVKGALTVAHNASSSPALVNLSALATGSLPRFAYSANGDNTVSSYTVDSRTGQLRSTGYVVVGTRPNAVAATPSGTYVYTANFTAGTISGYSTSSSGALTPVPGSPFPGQQFAFDLTVDPSGKFLYVANANSTSNNISGYTINQATGALTAISGSPFQAGNDTRAIRVDATGKFLYAANATSNDISAYTISAGTGVLTPITGSPFALPGGASVPQAIAIDSSSRFVFVGDTASPDVCAFTINPSTGALTVVSGSPFANSGENAYALSVDPSSRFLYAATAAGNVTGFLIDTSTGALTPVNNSPFTAGTNTTAVTVDPSGRFLYVADGNSGDVLVFNINLSSGTGLDGTLTLGHTILGRSSPRSLALATGTSPVTYIPKFTYAANSDDNTISAYETDPESGTLTPIAGSPFSVDGPLASDPQAVSLAIDPTGKFEYAVEFNGNGANGSVAAYTINAASGALTFTSGSPFTVGNQARSIVIDPSGRFAYVANPFSDNLYGFSINPVSGDLAALSGSPYSTGPATNPWSVAIDPSGQFLCLAKQATNQIESFSIDSISGNLTPIVTVPSGGGPVSVVVDPTGRFVYAATINGISAYTLSPSGSLTAITGSPFPAGNNTVSVAVDPTGRFLYTANNGSNDASAFTIDPNTGILVMVPGSAFPAGLNAQMASVDPSGNFVYVANEGANTVSAYTIDFVTGALTANTASPFTAGSVTDAITTLGTAH